MTSRTQKPRRRQRLGPTKRPATRKQKQADPSAPTDEEFATCKAFRAVRVMDDDGDEHQFVTGDDILVVPSGKDPKLAHLQPDTDNWAARIVKFGRRDNDEVWAKIKWYWSPEHVGSIVKTFDSSSHATRELFIEDDSHHYIPAESIIDTIEVVYYEDCDLEPSFIGPETFFCRRQFRPKVKHVAPFSPKELCLICHQPYNPDAAQKFPELYTMHFCPRETCEMAFHRECLSTHPVGKRPTCADRKLSLLCSAPSRIIRSSGSNSLISLVLGSEPTPPSKSRTRKRRRASGADVLSRLEDLPSDLVELASQPIVKPTFAFEFSDVYEGPPKGRNRGRKISQPESVINNVTGNITLVLKARVLINDILRGTDTLPQDWRKKIGWDEDTTPGTIVDGDENRSCLPFLCPICGEHI